MRQKTNQKGGKGLKRKINHWSPIRLYRDEKVKIEEFLQKEEKSHPWTEANRKFQTAFQKQPWQMTIWLTLFVAFPPFNSVSNRPWAAQNQVAYVVIAKTLQWPSPPLVGKKAMFRLDFQFVLVWSGHFEQRSGYCRVGYRVNPCLGQIFYFIWSNRVGISQGKYTLYSNDCRVMYKIPL